MIDFNWIRAPIYGQRYATNERVNGDTQNLFKAHFGQAITNDSNTL